MKYLTKQCRLILSIVERDGHVTAEEVHREAKKTLPRIAVGTVYRNLNELADSGIIRKIPVPDAPDRFDKTITPHEHLLCPDCGRLEDLAVEGLGACIKRALDSADFSFSLTVNARCHSCRGMAKS